MHMLGTEPRTMQAEPRYGDVVLEVRASCATASPRLAGLGIPREPVAIDPGIGFGKTLAHNLALLEP